MHEVMPTVYFKSIRYGRPSYTCFSGMPGKSARALLVRIGHESIQETARAEYEAALTAETEENGI